MKTIVIYFSENGKMETLSNVLREQLAADISEIQAVPSKIYSNKFMRAFGSIKNKGILPIENTVSDYENIVILVPVHRGCPSDEMCLFIRGYSLSDKRVYCIMCYEGNIRDAEEKLCIEFQQQDINCTGMLEINMLDNELLEKISKKEKIVYIDENGIYLRGQKDVQQDIEMEKEVTAQVKEDKKADDNMEIDFSYNHIMNKESQKK